MSNQNLVASGKNFFLDRLHNSSDVIAAVLDSQLVIQSCNHGFSKMIVPADEAIGSNLAVLLLPESQKKLETGFPRIEAACKLHFRSLSAVQLSLDCWFMSAGSDIFLFGEKPRVIEDNILRKMSKITDELANVSQELGRKNRALNQTKANQRQFIDIIAHEYRTPLSILQANLNSVEICLEHGRPIEKKYLKKMHFAIDRLSDLFSKSLQVAFSDERFQTHKLSAVQAGTILNRLKQKSKTLWNTEQIDFDFDMVEDPFLNCDQHLLTTALLNLIDNALKYSVSSTPISIKALKNDDFLQITFKNKCKPEDSIPIDKVFDKFTRGESRADIHGTGMGLYICRQIIEQHAGTVDLSQAESSSFQVEVQLPIFERPGAES